MVFVAKDLSLVRRVEELEYLGEMNREIAAQTMPPLSLAYRWLRRLRKRATCPEDAETLDKLGRQLRKVELTYDRLALYDERKGLVRYNPVLLTVSEVLAMVRNDLPSMEQKKIVFQCDADLPALRGDLFQLSFCIESILSYLLASLPEEESILMRAFQDDGWVSLRITGCTPPRPGSGGHEVLQSRALAKTLVNMALGEDAIRRFVEEHGGRYHEPTEQGKRVEFRIDLPVPGR